MRNIFLYSLIICVIILITGCASTTTLSKNYNSQVQVPISVNGSENIAFLGISFSDALKEDIGNYHNGIGRVHGGVFFRDESVAKSFNSIAYKELVNTGYNIVDTLKSSSTSVSSQQVRYQLSGVIIDLQANTFAPLSGNFTESKVTICWSLHNMVSDSTQSFTTDGYYKKDGIESGSENLIAYSPNKWESTLNLGMYKVVQWYDGPRLQIPNLTLDMSVLNTSCRNAIWQLLSNTSFIQSVKN
ncbi:MAG TPA: hypothetical protein PLE74_05920 [Candidatus Cloacimonadota bacterium]|nr:hypothetical protein [Candidatus Cloacimonadota bacterium]